MFSERVIRRGERGAGRVVLRSAFVSVILASAALTTAIAGAGPAAASTRNSGNSGASATATGSPVTIGLISDAGGSSSIATGVLVEQGAKAATDYVNHYLGGLEGHKVKIYICKNQSTPAGGQACANDMVQHGVVAVVEPFTGQAQTEVPTITGAGIPYITTSGSSTQELTLPGSYDVTGGFPADLGAMALSAKQHGYKKVTFLVINVPAAIQGAQALGGIVFKKAGVDFNVVPVDPGTADMTPQLQSAVSGGAKAVGMVGDVTFCSSFLKAYETLGVHLPRYVLNTCLDPSILHSPTLDKALAGSFITTTSKASKAELKEYATIIKKYDPKASTNPNVSTNQAYGVGAVLALANIMKGSKYPVTAAGIKQQLSAATNVEIPLSGGLKMTCNGKAIPLLKDVCSSKAAIGVVKAGKAGTVTHIHVYNPTPLF